MRNRLIAFGFNAAALATVGCAGAPTNSNPVPVVESKIGHGNNEPYGTRPQAAHVVATASQQGRAGHCRKLYRASSLCAKIA